MRKSSGGTMIVVGPRTFRPHRQQGRTRAVAASFSMVLQTSRRSAVPSRVGVADPRARLRRCQR